jgi:hypothetical protein
MRAFGPVALAGALMAGAASADHAGPTPIIVAPGLGHDGSSCWQNIRLFYTLRDGYFPYCRERMRYRPGKLECSQVTDRVCTVVDPVSLQLIEARRPTLRQVIPCPYGPEPPLCRKLDFR